MGAPIRPMPRKAIRVDAIGFTLLQTKTPPAVSRWRWKAVIRLRSGHFSHMQPDFLHGVFLQLPNPLSRDPVLVSELMQRGFAVGEPALAQNVLTALIQTLHRRHQTGVGIFRPVRLFYL